MTRRVSYAARARRWLRAELFYLEEHAPAGVGRLHQRMKTAELMLSDHPRIGAPGWMPGTRRLVVLPYVITYRERGDEVEIIDIRHSRQAERPIE
jgi:plasmid stabilization system protein ParE